MIYKFINYVLGLFFKDDPLYDEDRDMGHIPSDWI